MEGRSTRTTMVGQDVAMPVAIAPTGLTGMQHADGEILAARAAAFGVPFTLSTMSICSIEDMAEHTGRHPFWFQLYVMRDRDFIERLIDRAKAANCSALVLTLDLQILGQRHKDIKNGLSAPPKPTLANLINLATKPRWCLGMLGTKRRSFGNIVGHAKGVATCPRCRRGRPSSSTRAELGRCGVDQEALGRQADPQGHHGRRRRAPGRQQRRRCAHRQQPRRPPARRRAFVHRCAARIARRWARTSRCGWTAASAAGRTCSRPVRWARGTLIGRSFLYGLGAYGEAGVTRAADHPQGAGHHHGLLRPHQHQQRGPLCAAAGHHPHAVTPLC
jgi:L-lactate dehydrogenase (cytochrome)